MAAKGGLDLAGHLCAAPPSCVWVENDLNGFHCGSFFEIADRAGAVSSRICASGGGIVRSRSGWLY